MELMEQTIESPDLMAKLTEGLPTHEKHLIHLELMIMEQVQDWEYGIGRTEQPSRKWNKSIPALAICLYICCENEYCGTIIFNS